MVVPFEEESTVGTELLTFLLVWSTDDAAARVDRDVDAERRGVARGVMEPPGEDVQTGRRAIPWGSSVRCRLIVAVKEAGAPSSASWSTAAIGSEATAEIEPGFGPIVPSPGVELVSVGGVLSTTTALTVAPAALPNWSATFARTSYVPSGKLVVSKVAENNGPVEEDRDGRPGTARRRAHAVGDARRCPLLVVDVNGTLPVHLAGTRKSVRVGGVESTVTVSVLVVYCRRRR